MDTRSTSSSCLGVLAILAGLASARVLAQEAPEPAASVATAEPAGTPAPDASLAPASPPPPPATHSVSPPPALPPPPPEQKPEPCEREDRDAAEGAGSFLVGVGLFDFAALNDHLAAHGYDRVPSEPLMLGGEGRAVFRSGLVLGGHGAGITTPTGSGPGGSQTSFGAGYGMFDFGFAPVRTQSFLFMALAGIGGYGLGIDLGDNQNAKFDDVLANPRRSTSLSRAGLLFGLTLGIDGRVPIGKVERGRRGFFSVGLRIGGLYGLPLGHWTLPQGASVSGGPFGGLRGGFAMAAIGFGGGAVSAGPAAGNVP